MKNNITNEKENLILRYLKLWDAQFVSPTEIGKCYGMDILKRTNCHSSTVTAALKQLHSANMIYRNERGHYKYRAGL